MWHTISIRSGKTSVFVVGITFNEEFFLGLNSQHISSKIQIRPKLFHWISGERNVLTLGSLCLPCYMRETMWSYIPLNNFKNFQLHFIFWSLRFNPNRPNAIVSAYLFYLVHCHQPFLISPSYKIIDIVIWNVNRGILLSLCPLT